MNRRLSGALVAPLALALLLAMLLHQQLANLRSVPDLGDPIFSVWRLAWVNHQLDSDPAHLFDANIFSPERHTLTLSDPIIVPALLARPLSSTGLHPVVVYNLLLLGAFWLSGVATWLLVTRLTDSNLAGFIAGLLFATHAYRMDHYSHLELQMTFWMPLGLLALHRFLSTAQWPYVIALALAGVAQLYSSMYYGVFFLIYVTVVGLLLLLAHRPSIRPLLLPACAAALIAALITVPLASAFLDSRELRGDRPLDVVNELSATPADYLRTHRFATVWKHVALAPRPERALFPGAAPVVLGLAALIPPFSAARAVYLAAGLVAFDASRGFRGMTYPLLYKALPPMRGLRAPARFSILVGLSLSILGGFGAQRLLTWCRSTKTSWVLAVTMSAVILVDAWPTLTLVPVWETAPRIYSYLPANRPVVLAELPVLDDPGFNTPYLYFSLTHWRPMLNGYSGNIPASYNAISPVLMNVPAAGSLAALRARGVTHVTLNCGLGYVATCEETRQAMRRSPELRIIKDDRWQNAQVELYELLSTANATQSQK